MAMALMVTMPTFRDSLACCAVLLMSQAAWSEDAVQVENGTVVEVGQLDLAYATTLVFTRSAKIVREERPDVLVSARKQLSFAGQPPRSILMADWPGYLGVMTCRDGDRLYLFPYGEWEAANPDGKKKKRVRPAKGAKSQGASVGLRLSVPVTLQVVSNRLPPEKGPCSAEYPARFKDDPSTKSYWFTHSAPPPNWTRVELKEGRPGKKKAGAANPQGSTP